MSNKSTINNKRPTPLGKSTIRTIAKQTAQQVVKVNKGLAEIKEANLTNAISATSQAGDNTSDRKDSISLQPLAEALKAVGGVSPNQSEISAKVQVLEKAVNDSKDRLDNQSPLTEKKEQATPPSLKEGISLITETMSKDIEASSRFQARSGGLNISSNLGINISSLAGLNISGNSTYIGTSTTLFNNQVTSIASSAIVNLTDISLSRVNGSSYSHVEDSAQYSAKNIISRSTQTNQIISSDVISNGLNSNRIAGDFISTTSGQGGQRAQSSGSIESFADGKIRNLSRDGITLATGKSKPTIAPHASPDAVVNSLLQDPGNATIIDISAQKGNTGITMISDGNLAQMIKGISINASQDTYSSAKGTSATVSGTQHVTGTYTPEGIPMGHIFFHKRRILIGKVIPGFPSIDISKLEFPTMPPLPEKPGGYSLEDLANCIPKKYKKDMGIKDPDTIDNPDTSNDPGPPISEVSTDPPVINSDNPNDGSDPVEGNDPEPPSQIQIDNSLGIDSQTIKEDANAMQRRGKRGTVEVGSSGAPKAVANNPDTPSTTTIQSLATINGMLGGPLGIYQNRYIEPVSTEDVISNIAPNDRGMFMEIIGETFTESKLGQVLGADADGIIKILSNLSIDGSPKRMAPIIEIALGVKTIDEFILGVRRLDGFKDVVDTVLTKLYDQINKDILVLRSETAQGGLLSGIGGAISIVTKGVSTIKSLDDLINPSKPLTFKSAIDKGVKLLNDVGIRHDVLDKISDIGDLSVDLQDTNGDLLKILSNASILNKVESIVGIDIPNQVAPIAGIVQSYRVNYQACQGGDLKACALIEEAAVVDSINDVLGLGLDRAISTYGNIKGLLNDVKEGREIDVQDPRILSLLGQVIGDDRVKALVEGYKEVQSVIGVFNTIQAVPNLLSLMNANDVPLLAQMSILVSCLDLFNKVKQLISSIKALSGVIGKLFSRDRSKPLDQQVIDVPPNPGLIKDDLTVSIDYALSSIDTPINVITKDGEVIDTDSVLSIEDGDIRLERPNLAISYPGYRSLSLSNIEQVRTGGRTIWDVNTYRVEFANVLQVYRDDYDYRLSNYNTYINTYINQQRPSNRDTFDLIEQLPYLVSYINEINNTPMEIINRISDPEIREDITHIKESVQLPVFTGGCVRLPKLGIRDSIVDVLAIEGTSIIINSPRVDIVKGDYIQVCVSNFYRVGRGISLEVYRDESVYSPCVFLYEIDLTQGREARAQLVGPENYILLVDGDNIIHEFRPSDIGSKLIPNIRRAQLVK
jgi:hypothetical protein